MSLCMIVGAGPGLGAAIGRRFAKGGYQVGLIGRDPHRLKEVARTMSDDRGQIETFAADASDASGLKAAIKAARHWGGGIDALIYNAAAMHESPASALTAETFLADAAVNIGGALTCVSEILPEMKAKRRGTIIFTGGGLALEPYPAWSSLAAGKAALRAYAIALHKEVAAENVHVAVIAICGIIEPGGPFDPDLLADFYWEAHVTDASVRRRELVYLPAGADPYYNDPTAIFRSVSQPIYATEPQGTV